MWLKASWDDCGIVCVYNGVVLVILRWRKVKSYLMHIETTSTCPCANWFLYVWKSLASCNVMIFCRRKQFGAFLLENF